MEDGVPRQQHLYQVCLDIKECNEHNRVMADKFEKHKGFIPLKIEQTPKSLQALLAKNLAQKL